jgi:hypothetical protein
VTPSGRIDCKAWVAALPVTTHVAGQPHTARIRRSHTTTQVGVSHAMPSVLVIARDMFTNYVESFRRGSADDRPPRC